MGGDNGADAGASVQAIWPVVSATVQVLQLCQTAGGGKGSPVIYSDVGPKNKEVLHRGPAYRKGAPSCTAMTRIIRPHRRLIL